MNQYLNCLVVDDDILSLKAVESCISRTSQLRLVASCSNAPDAIKIIREQKIDLVFLDIEMPGTNGFEMLEQLKVIPQIILVSGKPEYAVDAFEYDVTDFLSKPFDFVRFTKSVNRAKLNHEKSNDVSAKADAQEFFIKKDSKFLRLQFSEVAFIEALADYIILYVLKDGNEKNLERHTILSTMKSIETKLPSKDFFRVHRSYIVRLDKIKAIEDNHVLVLDKQLPVSRSNKETLMKRLHLS